MAKKRTSQGRLPGRYPSVPDSESAPGTHNEPALAGKPDLTPTSTFVLAPDRSNADLRLRIEQLLLRREAFSADDWAALGDKARGLLAEMLDDASIRAHDAVFHRAIAVLGQLAVKRGITPLSAILLDRSEDALTRAYAATALGYIGEVAALEALATSITEPDDMVRRQVAKSLGRIDREAVIPHLLKLQTDKTAAVSEVAVQSLQRWETKLARRIGAKKAAARKATRRRKARPAAER